MPSNAMKLSQFRHRLDVLLAQHGDLDVVMGVPVDNTIVAIDGRNVNVAIDVLSQTLPAPVVVIGMWRDEQGRLRNTPGAVYETTGSDDGWSYVRGDAPDQTSLIVWKRYGGQDRGYREGECWFVYESGERAVEIIPAGVLAWRTAECP